MTITSPWEKGGRARPSSVVRDTAYVPSPDGRARPWERTGSRWGPPHRSCHLLGRKALQKGERISSEAGEPPRAGKMCLLEGLCEQRGERGPPSQALTPIRGGLPRLGCTACWEAGETNYPWVGRMLCTLFRAAWNLLDSPDLNQLPYSPDEQSDPQRNPGSCPQGCGQRCENGTGLLTCNSIFFPQHTL